MAVENFRKEERRYFIGRINRDKERETLRMENFNSLPTALRDRFDVGRGFDTAQTAAQGVNFFNSAEEEKGENRKYWYFRVDITNIELVISTLKYQYIRLDIVILELILQTLSWYQ